MKRAALLALAAGALVAAKPPMRYQPDPSSVIAAEIAFNRLAQAKGQWTAFRATAADDALMFVPQKVVARDWLKKQADPPGSISRSPAIVYVSCNGNLAASTGSWTRPDGAVGYFTTVWRRDKKGAWKWVLDHRDTLEQARPAPDVLTGKVATCKRSARPEGPPPPAPGTKRGAMPPPPDESLLWSAEVEPDNARRVTVRMWTGQDYETVIDDRVKAP